MKISELLLDDLISFGEERKNYEELFSLIADRLFQKGFVTKDYLEGLKKREEEFPTGLITESLNIALPHSDTKYVKKPFIYFVHLENEIAFKQMGDGQEMKVKDVFFLGIKEPSKQVPLLSSLMELFMNKLFVEKFIETKCPRELISLIENYQNKEEDYYV